MLDTYHISEIYPIDSSLYGEVAVVMAYHIDYEPDDVTSVIGDPIAVEKFYIPNHPPMIQSIITDQKENGYWTLNTKEFVDENIYNEDINDIERVHCHYTLLKIDSPDSVMITDMGKKCDNLYEARRYSDDPEQSMSDYILKCATEGRIGKFWTWLFGDSSLLNLKPDDLENLDDKYADELAKFIEFCVTDDLFRDD